MSDRLEIVYLGIDQLQPLKDNPRRAKDPSVIKKLAELIREHKFQSPLQVYREKDGKYSILCGNYRYQAGRSLGMEEFPCIIYEGDRNRALARAVSDNKSGEWTEFDLPKLSDLFREIDVGEFSLPDLTGFDMVEIEIIWTGMAKYDIKERELDENLKMDNQCPKCGYRW